jgi:hydroxypyruvate isomerase
MDRRAFLKATGAAALAQAAQAQAPTTAVISSVMIWTLQGPFEKRLEVASHAGVESVELVSEHIDWTDAQIREMKKLAASLHLKMDTIMAQSDWKHRPVSMVKPEDREGFLSDVRQAIVFAQKLEIPQIILMSGDDVPGRTHEEQYGSMLESVKRAGDLAAKANLTLIVEPLNNKVDHKGFFLNTCSEGLKLVKESQNPHVKLLFDIYHEQVQVGNVIRTMREAAPHVAVFHIADNPGRNDPGTGEMNYENIYKAIASFGYKGYVTMEYLPIGDQTASLTRATKGMRSSLPLSRSV